jgi:hypothetical protein
MNNQEEPAMGSQENRAIETMSASGSQTFLSDRPKNIIKFEHKNDMLIFCLLLFLHDFVHDYNLKSGIDRVFHPGNMAVFKGMGLIFGEDDELDHTYKNTQPRENKQPEPLKDVGFKGMEGMEEFFREYFKNYEYTPLQSPQQKSITGGSVNKNETDTLSTGVNTDNVEKSKLVNKPLSQNEPGSSKKQLKAQKTKRSLPTNESVVDKLASGVSQQLPSVDATRVISMKPSSVNLLIPPQTTTKIDFNKAVSFFETNTDFLKFYSTLTTFVITYLGNKPPVVNVPMNRHLGKLPELENSVRLSFEYIINSFFIHQKNTEAKISAQSPDTNADESVPPPTDNPEIASEPEPDLKTEAKQMGLYKDLFILLKLAFEYVLNQMQTINNSVAIDPFIVLNSTDMLRQFIVCLTTYLNSKHNETILVNSDNTDGNTNDTAPQGGSPSNTSNKSGDTGPAGGTPTQITYGYLQTHTTLINTIARGVFVKFGIWETIWNALKDQDASIENLGKYSFGPPILEKITYDVLKTIYPIPENDNQRTPENRNNELLILEILILKKLLGGVSPDQATSFGGTIDDELKDYIDKFYSDYNKPPATTTADSIIKFEEFVLENPKLVPGQPNLHKIMSIFGYSEPKPGSAEITTDDYRQNVNMSKLHDMYMNNERVVESLKSVNITPSNTSDGQSSPTNLYDLLKNNTTLMELENVNDVQIPAPKYRFVINNSANIGSNFNGSRMFMVNESIENASEEASVEDKDKFKKAQPMFGLYRSIRNGIFCGTPSMMDAMDDCSLERGTTDPKEFGTTYSEIVYAPDGGSEKISFGGVVLNYLKGDGTNEKLHAKIDYELLCENLAPPEIQEKLTGLPRWEDTKNAAKVETTTEAATETAPEAAMETAPVAEPNAGDKVIISTPEMDVHNTELLKARVAYRGVLTTIQDFYNESSAMIAIASIPTPSGKPKTSINEPKFEAIWDNIAYHVNPHWFNTMLAMTSVKSMGDYLQECQGCFKWGGYISKPDEFPAAVNMFISEHRITPVYRSVSETNKIIPYDSNGNALRLSIHGDRPSGARAMFMLLNGNKEGINEHAITGYVYTAANQSPSRSLLVARGNTENGKVIYCTSEPKLDTESKVSVFWDKLSGVKRVKTSKSTNTAKKGGGGSPVSEKKGVIKRRRTLRKNPTPKKKVYSSKIFT